MEALYAADHACPTSPAPDDMLMIDPPPARLHVRDNFPGAEECAFTVYRHHVVPVFDGRLFHLAVVCRPAALLTKTLSFPNRETTSFTPSAQSSSLVMSSLLKNTSPPDAAMLGGDLSAFFHVDIGDANLGASRRRALPKRHRFRSRRSGNDGDLAFKPHGLCGILAVWFDLAQTSLPGYVRVGCVVKED